MVRGVAKEQARERAAKQMAGKASASSQLKAREAAVKFLCPTCRGPMASYKTLKAHMESKHPGAAIPSEESFGK